MENDVLQDDWQEEVDGVTTTWSVSMTKTTARAVTPYSLANMAAVAHSILALAYNSSPPLALLLLIGMLEG